MVYSKLSISEYQGNLHAPLRISQDLLEDIDIVILQRLETISDTNMVELGMIPAIIPCSKIESGPGL